MKQEKAGIWRSTTDDYPWQMIDLPPEIWEWQFLGDMAIVIRTRANVSWWKRFWTRFFFGSTWKRIPQVGKITKA